MTQMSEQELDRIVDKKVKRSMDRRKREKRLEKQQQRLVEGQLKLAKVLERVKKANTVRQMITGQSGGKVTAAGRERLLALFQRVRRAEQIRMKIMETKVIEHYGSLAKLSGVDVKAISALEREHEDLKREINEFLKKHRLVPRAEFSYPLPTETRVGSGKKTWEALGARYILEIAVSHDGKPGEILRFRDCQLASCGQLFYATAAHQKFCTSQCRQAFFDSSPRAQRKRDERNQKNRYIGKLKIAYEKEHGTPTPMFLERKWDIRWKQERAADRKETIQDPSTRSIQ